MFGIIGAFTLSFFLCFSAIAEIKVISVSGKATYGGSAVIANQVLEPGQILDTSQSASVILSYPDGRKLQFKSGRAKLGAMKSELNQVELITGKLFGWFLKKRKNPEKAHFRIKTKTAVAGVRGTKFMIEERPKKTYFCVCEGELEVSKDQQVVALKKGYDLWQKQTSNTLGTPQYAQLNMLDMVAASVSEMGGTTDPYWRKDNNTAQ